MLASSRIPATQHLFGPLFMPKRQHGRVAALPRAARASSLMARSISGVTLTPRSTVVSARYGTSSFASDESREALFCRQPDKTRTEMRSILVEVPARKVPS